MLRNGGRWQNVTSNLFVPYIRLETVFIFFCCFVVILFLVWEERVSRFNPGCLEFCLPGWPQTQRSVSLASRILGLKTCITTSDLILILLRTTVCFHDNAPWKCFITLINYRLRLIRGTSIIQTYNTYLINMFKALYFIPLPFNNLYPLFSSILKSLEIT